jgi:hypothetical protein
MTPIKDALELLTAQHEQIEDLFEQVRQIGDESAFVELADKLATHIALERDVFYPAIAEQVSDHVMAELVAEHAALKQLLEDLVWLGTRDVEFRGKLAQLGELLYGHSAWQEEELFMRSAESMTDAELAALCDRFYQLDAIAIAA